MPTRVYIPTEPYTPTGESVYAQPAPPDNELLARPPEPQGALSRGINRLLGTQFGEERYQTWPEKMVRSAATLAGDVVSGAVPVLPPGSRREDFTDEPAPGVPDNAPWWKMAPVAAQPNDLMMERAQDLAGVAMGGGIGGTGKAAAAGEAVLGSGPVRPVMRNSEMPVASAREQQLLRKAVREQAESGEYKPWNENPRQDVPIKDLLATQDEVAPSIVQEKLRDKAYDDNDVFIVKHDGKYYVEDGHHTIAAAAQAGRPTINGHVQEIGAPAAEAAAGGKTLRSGMGDEGAGPVPINQKGPPWFSAVEHALEQTSMGSAPGAQWLATLRNARGVKPEEMAWLGLDDMLAEAQLAGRKVTRAEIQDHIKSHQVELRDVTKSDPASMPRHAQEELDKVAVEVYGEPYDHLSNSSANGVRRILNERTGRDLAPTKYHDYQLPGGENYREHLITMPDKRLPDGRKPDPYDPAQKELGNYHSSHWDEPNILAHVRTNDRVIDGKRALHLEEVQSDWHQQGRDKGYKGEGAAAQKKIQEMLAEAKTLSPDDPRYKEIYAELPRLSSQATDTQRVPDAPFKKSWHELALKRMLRRAAEEGYERLSWTPGDAQAARYGLSKHIEKLELTHNRDGVGELIVHPKNGRSQNVPIKNREDLVNAVGKEMADKLYGQGNANNGRANLEGLDLKVGGEGMRGFYDDILPKALQKIGREHGVKVQRGSLPSEATAPYKLTGPDGHDYGHFGSEKQAQAWAENAGFGDAATITKKEVKGEPIFYIDIPQSLRDAAMRKGFPLFSGGKMFVPHQEEDK